MDMREFHRALGESLDALDRASGAEERVKAAERQLSAKQGEIDALAAAHAKLKAQSDLHLAANLAKMNEETVHHNNEIDGMKKKLAAMQELHQTQQENASNTLTHLNMQVGMARKELDELNIELSNLKGQVHSLAGMLSGV